MRTPLILRDELHAGGAGRLRPLRRARRPEDPVSARLPVRDLAEHGGRYEHVGAWFAARPGAVHVSVTDPPVFRRMARSLGSAHRVRPGLRHEIFNEPERQTVVEDRLERARERKVLR